MNERIKMPFQSLNIKWFEFGSNLQFTGINENKTKRVGTDKMFQNIKVRK